MKKMKAAPQTGMRLLERGAKPDDRKRLALGKILKGYDEHAVFDVYEDEHGRIVLDPQVTIPAREAWLFKDKKALASVRRGLAQLGTAKPRGLGSFAAHADDEA
jgi:hypothetical protein